MGPINFSLPFVLRLPDGDYNVSLDEGLVVTLSLKKINPTCYDERMKVRGLLPEDLVGVKTVHILVTEDNVTGSRAKSIDASDIWSVKEFANISYFEMAGEKSTNKAPKVHIKLNGEIPQDRFGRFRFTSVRASINKEADIFRTALKALNKLIRWYRWISLDFWVREIREVDITGFLDDRGAGRIGPLSKVRADLEERHVDSMRQLLLSGYTVPQYENLLSDAENALDEENYKLSIIHALTALEWAVNGYLESRFDVEKISQSKQKWLMTRAGLKTIIRDFVSERIPADELDEETIRKCITSSSLRDDALHYAKTIVTQKDAKDALDVCRKISLILSQKFDSFGVAQTTAVESDDSQGL